MILRMLLSFPEQCQEYCLKDQASKIDDLMTNGIRTQVIKEGFDVSSRKNVNEM